MKMSEVKFEPYNENDDIEEYCEWLELFFIGIGVVDGKKLANLLSGLGAKTCNFKELDGTRSSIGLQFRKNQGSSN